MARGPAGPSRSHGRRRHRFPGDPGRGRLFLGSSIPAKESLDRPGADRNLRLTMTRRFYQLDQAPILVTMAAGDSAAGALPFVSVKTPWPWVEVAQGRHDDRLRPLISSLGARNRPVMLAVHHEPENDVTDQQTSEHWVAMQQHLLRMTPRLASSVTIVPVLMQYTFDPASGRTPQQWLVPGATVQGIDVYNPWRPAGNAPWVGFAKMLSRVRAVTGSGPIVVPEFGCHTDPTDLGRTRAWFHDAFDYALATDVVALAYFNSPHGSDGESWILDDVGRTALDDLSHRPAVTSLRGRTASALSRQ